MLISPKMAQREGWLNDLTTDSTQPFQDATAQEADGHRAPLEQTHDMANNMAGGNGGGVLELDEGIDGTEMLETQPDAAEATADEQLTSDEAAHREYSLRYQSGGLKRSFPSTWIDHDASGDYDPDAEARRLRAPKKRPRPLHREQLDWYGDTLNRADSAIGFKPIVAPRPPVRLVFTDPTAQRRLSEICTSAKVKSAAARDDFVEGYRLRKHKQAAGEQLTELGEEQSSAPSLPNDLTGHPCARGCKPCLRMGVECSLLLDEHYWPCEGCRGDESEVCELVVPPAKKLACLRCQRLRHGKHTWLRCSFLYDGDHGDKCESCAQDGEKDCIAQPDPSSFPPRIRIGLDGQSWIHDVPHVPKSTRDNSCKQCQAAKRMCSFSNGDSGDTCTACDMEGGTCEPLIAFRPKTPSALRSRRARQKKTEQQTQEEELDFRDGSGYETDQSEDFFDLSRQARSKSAPGEHGAQPYVMSGALPTSPAPATPLAQHATDQSSRGKVKRMQTKFCHPMRFNWEPTANDEAQCHFCSSVHFPILGLEEREIEVIEWDSGEGLEEISGGHAGDGIESTRVCLECTTARLEIVLCERHQLRPILGLNAAALDLETALANLMDEDHNVSGTKWCAICCNLATHECVTGCGLQLCKHCATALTYEYSWNLQEMLVHISQEASDERPLGLRADYELLKDDRLLVRYVQFANSQ